MLKKYPFFGGGGGGGGGEGARELIFGSVCMPHQSDNGYYKQPIKLPLLKENPEEEGLYFVSDLRTAIFIPL